MQGNGTRMLRVRAVADMFDVSTQTVYRAIESGRLHALKLGEGKGVVRIPEAAVRAWAASCAVSPEAEQSTSEVSGEVA